MTLNATLQSYFLSKKSENTSISPYENRTYNRHKQFITEIHIIHYIHFTQIRAIPYIRFPLIILAIISCESTKQIISSNWSFAGWYLLYKWMFFVSFIIYIYVNSIFLFEINCLLFNDVMLLTCSCIRKPFVFSSTHYPIHSRVDTSHFVVPRFPSFWV